MMQHPRNLAHGSSTSIEIEDMSARDSASKEVT